MSTNQTKKTPSAHRVKPNKHLGQCFLISGSVVKKIISAANLKPGETVLEIGPGTGVLTQTLLEAGARVIAVEKDKALTSLIISNFQFPISKKRLGIIVEDVLKFKESSIKKPYKIVANIPYYITGPIIQKFLFSKNPPTEMILMVQKEVGERIASKPPRANYLSSLVQFFAEAKILFRVKKECFWPKPKVDSAVIRLIPIPRHRVFKGSQHSVSNTGLVDFLRLAFKQPRQTLWNNLRRTETIPADKLGAVFEKLGMDKNIRAQNLDQQQLATIFQYLAPSNNVKFQSSNIKPSPKLKVQSGAYF